LGPWAQQTFQIGQRRAARRVRVAWTTWLYKKKVRRFDAVLRRRLCEMAASHVRDGYRGLTVLLRRDGWKVNAKRIYRLYTEEQLMVRPKPRRKIARRQRGARATATAPNQGWSMDFMSDKFADGRSFRILTVVDQFPRECVCLQADRAMTGMQVAQALERAQAERGRLPGWHYGGQWQ
jgi:putative transposase